MEPVDNDFMVIDPERANIFSNLSERMRTVIVVLHLCGYQKNEIAEIAQCSRKTVNLWIRRFFNGNLQRLKDNRKNNSRPRKTNPESDERIIHEIEQHPFSSSIDVKRRMNLPISARTLRRRFNKAEIFARIPTKKTYLTDINRQARLRFAEENWEHPPEHWNNVIFMDEKTFSTDEDGRRFVWRPRGKTIDPKYTIQKKHSGRITLGFWGFISIAEIGEIVEVGPRFNANAFVEILENIMKPAVRRTMPEDDYPVIEIVMDNSGVHRAAIVQEWFDQNDDFIRINWPAYGQDMNPVENLWGVMNRQWISGEISTKHQLRQRVHQVWNEMKEDENLSQRLIHSMPDRLKQIVENDGFWSNY